MIRAMFLAIFGLLFFVGASISTSSFASDAVPAASTTCTQNDECPVEDSACGMALCIFDPPSAEVGTCKVVNQPDCCHSDAECLHDSRICPEVPAGFLRLCQWIPGAPVCSGDLVRNAASGQLTKRRDQKKLEKIAKTLDKTLGHNCVATRKAAGKLTKLFSKKRLVRSVSAQSMSKVEFLAQTCASCEIGPDSGGGGNGDGVDN